MQSAFQQSQQAIDRTKAIDWPLVIVALVSVAASIYLAAQALG